MKKVIEPLSQIIDWSIDRIHYLAENGGTENQINAIALAEEFDEWINVDGLSKEIDYICLEREDDLDDQEIDVA
jgi:hypothetical protein